MSRRKTISVRSAVEVCNNVLANSDDDKAEGRVAAALIAEKILMQTGNYAGFRYLASEYPPASEQADGKVLRDGYDDTRRAYYLPAR